jgi:putative endonuclease
MKHYYVYILASGRRGTLYIGVTNDPIRRVAEHKEEITGGFTKKYGVKYLVYFIETPSIEGAILTEKKWKRWPRLWKIELIEKNNPEWLDLYPTLLGSPIKSGMTNSDSE